MAVAKQHRKQLVALDKLHLVTSVLFPQPAAGKLMLFQCVAPYCSRLPEV
jgi:hypothetical protein